MSGDAKMTIRDRLNRAAMSWLRPRASSGWLDTVTYNGVRYPLGLAQQKPSLGFTQEPIADTFTDYAQYAYLNNPVVFSLMERRRQVFSQAHFRFQQLRDGTPGRFFGTGALDILNGPGRLANCRSLMSEAIQHADLAGNAFLYRRADDIVCLRPDWVTIVAGSRSHPDQGGVALDAEVLGIIYYPGGRYGGGDPVPLLAGEYAHFKPVPDPTARFRGISWLKPVIKEIQADTAATTHKLMFFENGGTPSTVVTLDPAIVKNIAEFEAWVAKFKEVHPGGLEGAYETIFMGAGADIEVIGTNLRQLDFKVTQGAGETRLAAAAGVPPIIAGFSEGLASATYSNYGQARRAFSDITLWELWGSMSEALEWIIPPPSNARMWVDSSGIPFLQEDQKDAADVVASKANAMRTLWDGGADPQSVIDAVNSMDLALLKHTGNLSVQLQEAGAVPPAPAKPQQAAAVEAARAALVASGVARPTQAQLAEHLGVSDRTVRDWIKTAA